MKFRLLFVSMLFILAPMSGCLSSQEEDSTRADSFVNGSNSLIKMTDEAIVHLVEFESLELISTAIKS